MPPDQCSTQVVAKILLRYVRLCITPEVSYNPNTIEKEASIAAFASSPTNHVVTTA